MDFVSGGGAFLVHMTDKPHMATVRYFSDRAEANAERENLGGPYGYVLGSFDELVAHRLPVLVLTLAHQTMERLERFTTRKKIERKVWTLMSQMTKEENKLAKAEAAAKKKAAAEEKKAAAEAKKQAAEAKKAEALAAKEAKLQAAAQKKAEAAASKQARELAKSRISENEIITVLVDKNPKREGSASFDRFAKYQTGMTVKQFLEAGGTMGDINWDLGHRLISLGSSAS